MAEPLQAVFRRPFKEQVAAFRLRLGDLVPTSRWDDITGVQHDRAFMVAGATKADLLADMAAAIDKAIVEGTSLDEFRRDFREIVDRHGWHGWTGEGSAKGEAWRTKIIYRTNLASTRAAGRRAQHFSGAFRYLVYRHSGAENFRPEHQSWDGVILPVDHPFWNTHYPINAFNCGCFVRGARTLAGAIRVGGIPGKQLPEGWDKIDPKTGTFPGIGKGFDHAPGASVDETIRAATQKTVDWPYVLAKEFMSELPEATVDDFARGLRSNASLADATRRFAERALGARNGAPIDPRVRAEPYRTLGRITSDQVEAISTIVGKDVSGFDLTISPDAVRHAFAGHGVGGARLGKTQRPITVEDIGRIAGLWDGSVLHRGRADGRFLARIDVGGERYTMVFQPLRRRRMIELVSMWVDELAP